MYIVSRFFFLLAVWLFGLCAVPATIRAIQDLPPQQQKWACVIVPVLCVLAVIAARKKGHRLTAFGTAAWASSAELERAGMLGASRGLILGRIPATGAPLFAAVKALVNRRLTSREACREFRRCLNPRHWKKGRLVRLSETIPHVLVCSPTGGGKGVSCIIPFLQTCDESCVVIDFKGENALITSAARRRMGHKVVILDPYNVVAAKLKRRTDTLNPLGFIRKDSDLALDECRDIAESLVIRTGEEKDPHWNDSAEAVIAAITAAVVHYAPDGQLSLQAVRDILANPDKFEIAKKLMVEHGSMLARWGGQLDHLRGEEFASVMSTAHRHVRFLDTPVIAESTSRSSFDPAGLKKGKMTIYLVLPPEHARAQSGLLRLWISSLFRACLRSGLGESRKVHFVLDESAALGHMPSLDDAVDKMRGYGVRLQFYYQSLGQLAKCWPHDKGQTLLSNTAKVFFGVNDLQTAEYISKTIGNQTIVVESGGTNKGWSRSHNASTGHGYSESSGTSYSQGSNTGWQQNTRELLKPDEIMQIGPRIAISLIPAVRPVCTTLLRWYEEKSLLRHPGWLRRLAAACWTLCLSATLLVCALIFAAVVAGELGSGPQPLPQPVPAFPGLWPPAPGSNPPASDLPRFNQHDLSGKERIQ